MIECKNCNKSFIPKKTKQLFCCVGCRQKYMYRTDAKENKRRKDNQKKIYNIMKNNEQYKEMKKKIFKRWYRNNKLKHRKKMLENYHKNKKEWKIRSSTYKWRKKIFNIRGNRCERCGSTQYKTLELHHICYKKCPDHLKSKRGCSANEKRLKFYCSITRVLCNKCHSELRKK